MLFCEVVAVMMSRWPSGLWSTRPGRMRVRSSVYFYPLHFTSTVSEYRNWNIKEYCTKSCYPCNKPAEYILVIPMYICMSRKCLNLRTMACSIASSYIIFRVTCPDLSPEVSMVNAAELSKIGRFLGFDLPT